MATQTLAPVAPVAVIPSVLPTDDTPTVETLRAAFAAYDTAAGTAAVGGATLAALVLARYAFHANAIARNVDGTRVLMESDRSRVAKTMWLDVAGHEAPAKGNDYAKSPATTSLGQYLSRYGTVAVNFDFGVSFLGNVESAKLAYADISEGKSAAKTATEDRLFNLFVIGLSETERAAFDSVESIMHAHGAEHFDAFKRVMAPPAK